MLSVHKHVCKANRLKKEIHYISYSKFIPLNFFMKSPGEEGDIAMYFILPGS